MKRSEIQRAIVWAKSVLEDHKIVLPMFAYWSMDEWKKQISGAGTILNTMRGWDVTTFGGEDFNETGAVLFTLRNGTLDGSNGCPYAEKLILMKEGQVLPNHYHKAKTEDIINRGGGVLIIKVWNSLPDGTVDRTGDVKVLMDGMVYTVPAGTEVEVTPGNSMTIYPGLYHLFTPKKGCGDLIVGEVSSINDDRTDNYFEIPRSRFNVVDEDEPIEVPLCNEYDRIFG